MKIIKAFKLVLPILFPSWRFFSGINVSPRFDIGFAVETDVLPSDWTHFRPLPASLSFGQTLLRLIHNPRWNELLFLNSCAERLLENGLLDENVKRNPHKTHQFYLQEIADRLLAAVRMSEVEAPVNAQAMCFRIRVVYSEDAPANVMGQVREKVAFISDFYPLTESEL